MTNEVKIVLTGQDRTRAAVESAKKGLKEIQSAGTSLQGTMAKLSAMPSLGTITAGLSAAGLIGFVHNAIDAADAANDMHQRFGIAVQDFAGFDLAARQSGTSLEGVAQGLKAFSKFVVENGDDLRKAGIDTTNTKAAFIQFADVVAGMPDGLEKTALAQKALGKAGADLIPLLNLGRQGLQESADKSAAYGAKLAQLAPLADAFNDKMEELKLASSAVGINMAITLIPTLTDVITKMAEATEKTGSLRGGLRSLFEQGIGLEVNSWSAIFKQMDINALENRIKVLQGRGDRAGVIKAQERLKKLYEEVASLGNDPAPQETPPQKAADGMASGNAALEEQMQRYQALIEKLLTGGDGRSGRQAKLPKAPKDIDTLGDFMASLGTREADRLEGLRDHWLDLLDPVEHFRQEYAEVEELAKEGYLTGPQALAAYRQLDEEMEKLGDGATELKDALAQTETGKLEAVRTEMQKLADLLSNGDISSVQYLELVDVKLGRLGDKAQDVADDMDQFMTQAARNIQDAFADFLFDPFKDGLDGMLKNFGQTIQRMIAQAVAADLGRRLFGADFASGKAGSSIGGWVGDALGALGGLSGAKASIANALPGDALDNFVSLFAANGHAFSGAGTVAAFASGGAFGNGSVVDSPTLIRYGSGGAFAGVVGEAGPEGALPLKRLANGKLGVHSDGGGGGLVLHQNFHIAGNADAATIKKAGAQSARELMAVLRSSGRYV
jgi:hypothetical protein